MKAILCYVHANRKVISGETVSRALYFLYTLGYEPNAQLLYQCDIENANADSNHIDFEDFGPIIERDFDFLPGLVIVRTCLALTFYRALPMNLLDRVFDLKFIMRLEQEISSISSMVKENIFHMLTCKYVIDYYY